MFSRQKAQIDVKKSTQKLLDLKKDIPTRLKHLKLILENVDGPEAKSLFSTHYSHIYHLVYEGIVSAEGSLKQRGVHRAQREELEGVLYLLEKIIVLLPDLLHCRWQLHSFSRLMAKLNHPANSIRLRRESTRLFLMWYQCLGTSAPNYVHSMFAALIPGLGGPSIWPPPVDSSWGITPLEITPVLPASTSEKQPDDLCSYFLECLLDFMVSQAPKIHWNDGATMWAKSIDFLYERFKEYYLPKLFPGFSICTDIYKPNLIVPQPTQSADMSSSPIFTCQVVFIKWIANYAHSVYRSMDCYQQSTKKNQTTVALYDENSVSSTRPTSMSDRDSITSYVSIPSDVDANVIAKDVILGTRENINLLHEVFRRALLMNFVHSAAIRRVICVYKDWIQVNVPELPIFMLEPESESEFADEKSESTRPETPKARLRTDSYYGAVGLNANNNREEFSSHLRAGAQKVLRVFFCNSASVFLLFQIPKHDAALALLEEQVDVCKRVLNIYRYAVMNTSMDSKTWEQLLVVMLHITSSVLDQNHPHRGIKYPDSLGHKLASPLFQTLIVSWVKASLNVPISTELWDQLQTVLSQLTISDDLITEWAKTMETLTRVLSRHVYKLDLANLPLDKLTEQKAKRKRGLQSGTFTKDTFKQIAYDKPFMPRNTFRRKRNSSSGGTSERKSMIFSPSTPFPQRKAALKRSLSDGNLVHLSRTVLAIARVDPFSDANGIPPIESAPRIRKVSRSMDSLRKFIPKEVPFNPNSNMNPEWAEISSSTTSLENTSNIGENDGMDMYDSGKPEPEGVISGGEIKGWLPNVAAILWKRMLGVLGDVNEFQSPKTHAHFFQVITDIWNTLFKVRQNQGVSLDNMSTPRPSELVPPITIFAPWCLQALELPSEFNRGKLLACDLLCQITFANQDIPFYQEYLCRFYATFHKSIVSNNQEIVNIIVKRCGLRFTQKMMPGFSLVLLDLIQASHSVLTSDDFKSTPRMEAATLLAGLLTIADIFKDIPVLKPAVSQFQQISSKDTKEIVMACLLRFSKVEQTSQARAIALQGLTIYMCEQLIEIRHSGNSSQTPSVAYKNRINEIFSILLASVKVENRSIALVASNLLLLLVDFAGEVSTYFPNLCSRIIMGLKWSLQQALPLKAEAMKVTGRPVEMERRLLISLMLTLGEWCMQLPADTLLVGALGNENISLLSTVFDVLIMVTKGYQTATESSPLLSSLEDFDPSIPVDDLQTGESFRPMGKDNAFARPDSTNGPGDSLDGDVVKLAARSLMLHLMTQLGHFPIANGAARCGSIVTENDDLPGINSELDELSANIFTLSNVQLFALDNQTLLTMIELPTPENQGEGMTAGFQTSPTQVRLILRDLSGKASWDALHLHAPPNICGFDEADSFIPMPQHVPDELFYQSAMTGIFLPQLGPRLTLRRRPTGLLPTVADSAEDLDNLDDLLQYVGHTSPECLLRVGEPLTAPWGPPHSVKQENEDDVVAAVVNQRNIELEYLMRIDPDPSMRAKPISMASDSGVEGSECDEQMLSLGAISKSSVCSSSFLLSRRLFSQFGFTGWDKRSKVDLLVKDEKLLRQLKHLDAQKCREAHKIAIIYVAQGQEDKQSILFNTGGSEAYEDFVAGLGWEVELENHTGFMGGLQKNKSSGETAPYYATSFTEVIFHVSTRMPSNTEECLLQKTRHLGNDEVHIVWSEHNRDYRRDIIPTEFCDVLIVIYPLPIGLFRVQISRKPEVPYFGPLFNEAVIGREILAPLVRATAINASRAKRSSLPFFQHHFQERAKSLSTITEKHKTRTAFEQFASNVFCPLLPPLSFQPGAAIRASATSFSSSARTSTSTVTSSNQLASALLDHSISSLPGGSSGFDRRMTRGQITSAHFQDIPLTSSPAHLSQSDTSTSAPQTPVAPIPPKRLSMKLGSGSKPKMFTPPASPAVPRALSSGSNTKQ